MISDGAISLHKDLSEYRSKKEEKEGRVFELLTSASNSVKKKVTFDLDGFELNTYATIPKKVRDTFLSEIDKLSESEDKDKIDGLDNLCAWFMAEMCYDEELKNEDVWIQYNEECGCLQSVARGIFEELSVPTSELKRVCRK